MPCLDGTQYAMTCAFFMYKVGMRCVQQYRMKTRMIRMMIKMKWNWYWYWWWWWKTKIKGKRKWLFDIVYMLLELFVHCILYIYVYIYVYSIYCILYIHLLTEHAPCELNRLLAFQLPWSLLHSAMMRMLTVTRHGTAAVCSASASFCSESPQEVK